MYFTRVSLVRVSQQVRSHGQRSGFLTYARQTFTSTTGGRQPFSESLGSGWTLWNGLIASESRRYRASAFLALSCATAAVVASRPSVAHAAAPVGDVEATSTQHSVAVAPEGSDATKAVGEETTSKSVPRNETHVSEDEVTTPESGKPSRAELARVRAALNELLDENDDLGPALVGLAWISCSSYDVQSGAGGSSSGASQALADGRRDDSTLEPARIALRQIGGQYPSLSSSDLVTLAGTVAVEHMGGPFVKWRPGRVSGRGNSAPVQTPRAANVFSSEGETRLYAAVRYFRAYWERQGFSEREIVALMGALAVCHGYPARQIESESSGEWARRSVMFSNEYFRDLVGCKWYVRDSGGQKDIFVNSAGTSSMEIADMALLWDMSLRKYVEEFAEDEDSFFDAFASAFQKLEENGVAQFKTSAPQKPWYKFW